MNRNGMLVPGGLVVGSLLYQYFCEEKFKLSLNVTDIHIHIYIKFCDMTTSIPLKHVPVR